MKKMIHTRSIFLRGALALLVSMALVCSMAMLGMAEEYPLVNDEAGLMSESEAANLQEKAEQYSAEYEQDIVIYTTNSLGGQDIMAAADDYFDYNGFGQGDEYSGIVLVVDMGEREYWLSTCGETITTINDNGLIYVEDAMLSDLSSGDYYGAFDAYVEAAAELMQQAADGSVYDGRSSGSSGGSGNSGGSGSSGGSGNSGSNGSSGSSGSSNSSSYNSEWLSSVLTMSFGISAVVALVFCGICVTQLRSASKKHSAADYVAGRGLDITHRSDLYLFSNTVRQRRQENNGGGRGGGGSHRGSSGRSHGGRGGRF